MRRNAKLSVAQITSKAITLLCRELGPVDTARFLNQFSTGFGNYTENRDQVLGDATVDKLVAEIKQRRAEKKRNARRARSGAKARSADRV